MRKFQLIVSLIPPLLFTTAGPYFVVLLGARAGLREFYFNLALPIGVFLIAVGVALSSWSAWFLYTRGEGTPLPLMPPKKFVGEGPYKHVRNPMLLGMHLVVAGETLYTGSAALLMYLAGAIILSHTYIVLIEEKELKNRFRDAYDDYKSETPRWIPRPLKKPK